MMCSHTGARDEEHITSLIENWVIRTSIALHARERMPGARRSADGRFGANTGSRTSTSIAGLRAALAVTFRSLLHPILRMHPPTCRFDHPPDDPARPLAPSDDVVIDEVLRGNREMFEVLVRRYNTRLYRVGMSYLRSHTKAEDAMQNTYLKCFLHLAQFERGAAFGTWLTRIMINECLMALRQNKRDTLNDAALEDEHESVGSYVSDTIHLNELKALLEKAINTLPQRYRTIYMLRYVQQLSTAETAECLGISEDSAKVLLHRARARLKDELLKSAAGVELFSYPAPYCNPMTESVLKLILRASLPER